jgi:hypothetical protein
MDTIRRAAVTPLRLVVLIFAGGSSEVGDLGLHVSIDQNVRALQVKVGRWYRSLSK